MAMLFPIDEAQEVSISLTTEAPLPRFTVFTPVYNRRDTLHRPFESLKAQTLRDFEWIVVDDGSTDDSLALLREIQKEANFPMRLFSQPNMGKHVASNYASREAKGELCVQLDSDDTCVPEALETFARIWDAIDVSDRTGFSGINVLCIDPATNKASGDFFPKSPMDTNNLELSLVHKLKGEHWGCIRVDLLRKYPFPQTDQSTYIPENVVWFRLAKHYKVRCVNIALRGYFRDQQNAITKRHLTKRNLYGDWYFNTSLLTEHLGFLIKTPSELLWTAANTWRYARHANVPLRQWRKTFGWRILFALPFVPLGELLYRRDRGLNTDASKNQRPESR